MAGETPPSPDDRDHLVTRLARERRHWPLAAIDRVEDLVHYIVAILLLTVGIVVLARTIEHLIVNRADFALQVTSGINDLLFVVIVMELLRTVIAHLETEDFQLRSFLIVGIIAAVRHIVGVGARLTLSAEQASRADFERAQIELGVSAAVVLALALGLFLISRSNVE
jgi:uncharacterized membrane protein (DUF373 family)